MNKRIATIAFMFLTACQTLPKLEDDLRYVKLATVVDKHEFSEIERKQARENSAVETTIGINIGVGLGRSYSGTMFGMGGMMGTHPERRDAPPKISQGAIRYTVQLQGSQERIEVMSYGQYTVGDCLKALAGHPTEYPRFFELKAEEHCQ